MKHSRMDFIQESISADRYCSEQTREANKRIKIFFFLDCMFIFGNIVSDFHV